MPFSRLGSCHVGGTIQRAVDDLGFTDTIRFRSQTSTLSTQAGQSVARSCAGRGALYSCRNWHDTAATEKKNGEQGSGRATK